MKVWVQTAIVILVCFVSQAVAAVPEIKQLSFSDAGDKAGQLMIPMPEKTDVELLRDGQELVLTIPKIKLSDAWQTRMDVTEFNTVVDSIVGSYKKDVSKLVFHIDGPYTYRHSWDKKTLRVMVMPLSNEMTGQQFTGKRLSLNFQNIAVRSVLQILAEFTGLNIVVSDSVQGSITLHLKDVPWDQALSIILKSKGLGERRTGNVIYIAPQTEIALQEKTALEALLQQQKLAPLKTSYLRVNYANAMDIAKLLQDKENSMLTDRGRVSYDERTNTLLIKDTPKQLTQIKNMLTLLDIPVQQVLIEARIVEVNKNALEELGITAGKDSSGNTLPAFTVGNQSSGREDAGVGFSGGVNNPISGTASGILGLALRSLPGGFMLDLELQALETEGEGRVISAPKLIVSNKEEAYIEQGSEVPYLSATSSGATQVQFKKAVLGLRVTPQITPNNKVLLDLQVNKDKISTLSIKAGDTPVIDTRVVKTQVMVNNGQTIVLGGIYEKTKEHKVQRIPFLSSIPLIGPLFQSKSDTNKESEMLIFITPKIIMNAAEMSKTNSKLGIK